MPSARHLGWHLNEQLTSRLIRTVEVWGFADAGASICTTANLFEKPRTPSGSFIQTWLPQRPSPVSVLVAGQSPSILLVCAFLRMQ